MDVVNYAEDAGLEYATRGKSGRQRPVDYWINPRIKIAALWTAMLSRDRWAARISPALPR